MKLVFFVFVMISTLVHSQSQSCNTKWWIGYGVDKYYLDFTGDDLVYTPFPSSDYMIDDEFDTSVEQTASFSVQDQLWLFSDGINLFDGRADPPILVTAELGSRNTEADPVIIFPLSGNCMGSFFAVIVQSRFGMILYYTIDVGNIPATIVSDQTISSTTSMEGMTIVASNSNPPDVWLVYTTPRNSSSFNIVTQKIHSSGELGISRSLVVPHQPGRFGIISCRKTLCVLSLDFKFLLFNFDVTTGMLSLPQDITPESTFQNVGFSILLSENERFLYFVKGGSLRPAFLYLDGIYQMDLSNNNVVVRVDPEVNYFTGISLGPDGKIYLSRQETDQLGVINFPNQLCPACGFELLPANGFNSSFRLVSETVCSDFPPVFSCSSTNSHTPSNSQTESPTLSESASTTPSSTIPTSTSPTSTIKETSSPSPSITETNTPSKSNSAVNEAASGPSTSTSTSPSAMRPSQSNSGSNTPSVIATASTERNATNTQSSVPSPVNPVISSNRIPVQSPITLPSVSSRSIPEVLVNAGTINGIPEIATVEAPENFPSIVVQQGDATSNFVQLSSSVIDVSFLRPEEAPDDFSVEICITPTQSGSACLGFFDETETPARWKCEDTCLEKKEGKQCGTTSHFTNFALLLDPSGKGFGGCSSEWDYITNTLWGDIVLISSVSILFACCVVFFLVMSFVPWCNRVILGEEGDRIQRLRSSAASSTIAQLRE